MSSFPFHFCLNSNSYQGPGCGQVAGGDSAPQNDTDHHDHDDEGKCLESLCQSLSDLLLFVQSWREQRPGGEPELSCGIGSVMIP